jgi:hypothetical protein
MVSIDVHALFSFITPINPFHGGHLIDLSTQGRVRLYSDALPVLFRKIK